jgi:hypothetical protein
MKAEEFVIWFKGFVAGSNNYDLTPAGWEAVKAQLEKVGEDKVKFKSEEEKALPKDPPVKDSGIDWKDLINKPVKPLVPYQTKPLPYQYPQPYWWQQPSTVEPFKVTCSAGSGVVSVQSSELVDLSATGTAKPPQFFTYTSTPNQK